MGISFSAEDAFEIALDIETNGQAFYEKAAANQPEGEIKSFLESLAGMEKGHVAYFTRLKEDMAGDLPESGVFDPDDETVAYLKAMADNSDGEGSKKAFDGLEKAANLAEVIQIALDAEKKAVEFYNRLKSFVPPQLGRDKLDIIIGEEEKHVTQLTEVLNNLS